MTIGQKIDSAIDYMKNDPYAYRVYFGAGMIIGGGMTVAGIFGDDKNLYTTGMTILGLSEGYLLGREAGERTKQDSELVERTSD